MHKLIRKNKVHAFYHYPSQNSFNIIPKDDLPGIHAYPLCKPLMLKYNYCKPYTKESEAREMFFGIKKVKK